MTTSRWHMRPHELDGNHIFISKCLRLWDMGLDTKDISHNVFQPEWIVESAVRLGRELRRQVEQWDAKEKEAGQ